MAYPLLCAAGYGVPIKQGTYKITKIVAAVNDTTAASRVTIYDGKTENGKYARKICDLKGTANVAGNIGISFDDDPVQLRDGIFNDSLVLTNVVAGSVLVYIR